MNKILLAFFTSIFLYTQTASSQNNTPKYLSVLSGNYGLSNYHLVPVGNAQALSVGNTRFSWVFMGNGMGAATITRLDSAARPVWSKFYDMRDTGTNHINSVFADIKASVDGNFGLVGNTGVYTSQFGGTMNYGSGTIIKITPNGNVLWSSKFVDTSAQKFIPQSLAACSDSGFVVCGKVLAGTTSIASKCFIARVGKNGNLLWMKKDTSSVSSVAHSIVNIGDTAFYMIGAQTIAGQDITTIWYFNAAGAIQWTKNYELSTNTNSGYSILHAAGALYCVGSQPQLQLFKMAYSGAVVFAKTYSAYAANGSEENCKPKLKNIRNNQLLISNSNQTPDAVITNSLGEVQWAGGILGYNLPSDVVQLNNKDLMFSTNDNYKIMVAGKDSLVWGQVGFAVTDSLGSGAARCYSTEVVNESNTAIAVMTVATGFQSTGTLSVFQTTVISINTYTAVGCLGYPVSIREVGTINLRVFPNPASSRLFIESENSILNESKFALYTMQGELVLTTAVNSNENGSFVDITTLTPGIYLYRLETASKELQVGKLIIAQGD